MQMKLLILLVSSAQMEVNQTEKYTSGNKISLSEVFGCERTPQCDSQWSLSHSKKLELVRF